MPLLVRMFDKTEGDVLEMGMGHFSTPVLKWLCEMSGRTLYSYESKIDWYEKVAQEEAKPFHRVIFCSDWASADIERHWGLAFIDHSPMRKRYVDIKRLASHADILVIHDTQPESDQVYNYSTVFPLFKYRLDFTKFTPWTSAVSNSIDVSKMA